MYVLFIKSTRTLPVGSESLAFTCSGLNFLFVWYRRFGFSLSMIFFNTCDEEMVWSMQTFSTICPRKWQPSVDLTGTVSRLTQCFIGITASEIALLRRSIQKFWPLLLKCQPKRKLAVNNPRSSANGKQSELSELLVVDTVLDELYHGKQTELSEVSMEKMIACNCELGKEVNRKHVRFFLRWQCFVFFFLRWHVS